MATGSLSRKNRKIPENRPTARQDQLIASPGRPDKLFQLQIKSGVHSRPSANGQILAQPSDSRPTACLPQIIEEFAIKKSFGTCRTLDLG